MKKILTIVVAALLAVPGHIIAQESSVIGKSNIKLNSRMMTPETLWAMGRIGAVLQAPRLWFSAPLLAWGRPLVNAYYRLREARNQRSNYTSYH